LDSVLCHMTSVHILTSLRFILILPSYLCLGLQNGFFLQASQLTLCMIFTLFSSKKLRSGNISLIINIAYRTFLSCCYFLVRKRGVVFIVIFSCVIFRRLVVKQRNQPCHGCWSEDFLNNVVPSIH